MPSDPPPNLPPSPAGKPRRRPSPGVSGNWMWVAIMIVIIILSGIEAAKDIRKAIRHSLTHYLLIHDAKLLPDFRLDLGAELRNGLRLIVF